MLGMVTLNDLERLERESATGRGWIACTTDALFMERPQYYDLIIDLTTSTPYKNSRPTLHLSKCTPASTNGKKKASYKLETVRFTWSDVKLVSAVFQFSRNTYSRFGSGPNLTESSNSIPLKTRGTMVAPAASLPQPCLARALVAKHPRPRTACPISGRMHSEYTTTCASCAQHYGWALAHGVRTRGRALPLVGVRVDGGLRERLETMTGAWKVHTCAPSVKGSKGRRKVIKIKEGI